MGELKHIREVITECLVSIDRARHSDRLIWGLPTGFLDLDYLTTGFYPGDLVVVAGSPGVGKSGFMLSMALNLAFWENVPVAIFSLETSKRQLMLRMLSILSGVPLRNMRIGFVGDEAWSGIVKLSMELAEKPIYVDDNPRLTTVELRERSKKLREEKGIEAIFVDYLQLLRGHFVRHTRQEEVAEISMELKALAKELQIPVVALSQLSRQVEQRRGKRPQLADLRESGQIEEVADMVIFIHRPSVYELLPSPEEDGVAEVILAKNRHGPTGIVKLAFDKKTTAFRNYMGHLWRREEIGEEEGLPEDFDLDF
jgi:replicative DNA helicase